MTVAIQDKKPPLAVVRMLNPINRLVARSPLGRLLPVALLRFSGRKSGRTYEVPVVWYELASGPVVFTPAGWRANFAGGAPVTTRVRGRVASRKGTLVTDPVDVAAALNEMIGQGGHSLPAGLKVPAGHQINAADVMAVDRAMIRFT